MHKEDVQLLLNTGKKCEMPGGIHTSSLWWTYRNIYLPPPPPYTSFLLSAPSSDDFLPHNASRTDQKVSTDARLPGPSGRTSLEEPRQIGKRTIYDSVLLPGLIACLARWASA